MSLSWYHIQHREVEATLFYSSLNSWKSYCQRLKSSQWLMGDGFKLALDWALKFMTIDKILAGSYGVKAEATTETPPSDQQIIAMIDALPDSNKAKEDRHLIAKTIGYPAYLSWFHQAEFREVGRGIALIAPNPFVEEYWKTHFPWLDSFGEL